jgi:hypothetical protein
MGKLLLFAVMLVFASLQTASGQLPGTGKRFKSVTEYNVENKKRELDHLTLFNEAGVKTEETEYFSDGMVKTKTIFEYDPQWRCIKSTKYGQKGKIERVSLFEYDAEGHKTKETIVVPDKRGNQQKVFDYTFYP